MIATLNGTLKFGSGKYLPPGHTFNGRLEDFPEDIQELINQGHRIISVEEDPTPKEAEAQPKSDAASKINPVTPKKAAPQKASLKKAVRKRKKNANSG